MSLRHARITAALALLLVSVASAVHATTLWDQSAISFSSSAPGIYNGKFTGFGGSTSYCLNDVTVPAGGWTINTITEYFSNETFADMQLTAPNGYLIIMPKTGSLPVGAPTTTTVPLTWVATTQGVQSVYVMTASGLNVNLAAGDYWITVAPITPVDNFNGNNLQWPALTTLGAPVATYNGATWSDLYPGYDGAFKIDGTGGGATPTRAGTWGSLKALYR